MIAYDKVEILRDIIKSEKNIVKGRLTPEAFTRKSKMGFKNIEYFILNKRGVTLEMEIDNFKDIMQDEWEKVTESAICQQRKKINPEVIKDLNREYIKCTYDEGHDYEEYKGYIVLAIDGMNIELPNVDNLKKEYGEAKGPEGQRTVARATTSSIYDVVNKMVIDSSIGQYRASERELAKANIEEMLKLLGKRKILIIFDRGYPSLDMICTLEKNSINYLIRLNKSTYAKEVRSMKADDEIKKIELTPKRVKDIKDRDTKKELLALKELKIRFVKYKLETGETEILITNLVRDNFSTEEIGEMYFKRWKIELAYDVAKNKLDIQNFSGQSKVVIEQEYHAQILLLNIAEDLRKEANKKISRNKLAGYKYDYQANMNILVGKLRKRFLLIILNIKINSDEESKRKYDELIKEISESVIPIRLHRKNPRNKYKGYNKYKQNFRRNS
jgi:hypothetical protein